MIAGLLYDVEFDLALREIVNGAWFVLCLAMMLTLCVFVGVRVHRTSRSWYRELDIQTAIALLVFVTGSTIRAGWIWIFLHCENAGLDCDSVKDVSWLLMLAAAFAIIGVSCTLRVLSPPELWPWSWITPAALAVTVPLLFYSLGGQHLRPDGVGIIGHHDSLMVALSVAVAIMASYAALDLADRVRATAGAISYGWLLFAAFVMGGGIWSMHFIAMLAFSLPDVPVSYDLRLTLLSLVVPIVVTAIGFLAIKRAMTSWFFYISGGMFVGIGIVAMHYIGMAAMRMPADLSYDALLVSASVLIAIGASIAGTWLAFRDVNLRQRLAAAVVQGLAVSGMHYVAMAAAAFHAMNEVASPVPRALAVDQAGLAIGVAVVTISILGVAIILSVRDRRLAARW